MSEEDYWQDVQPILGFKLLNGEGKKTTKIRLNEALHEKCKNEDFFIKQVH